MLERLTIDPTLVRKAFRFAAFAEALSWAGLLAGMYVKYLGSGAEIGVQIFGALHGGIFLVYVAVTLLTWRTFGWSWRVGLTGLAAGIPPFATVPFDLRVERTGRLEVADRPAMTRV